MSYFRNYLEKLSIVKTQQQIKGDKVMAILAGGGVDTGGAVMTQGQNNPNPPPFGGMPGVSVPAPNTPITATNSLTPPNPWSDPVVKQNLQAQRLVYTNALVDLNNKKQAALNDIAQIEDTLEFTLKAINDLDLKIKG